LIDEFQDTDSVQYKIVRTISKKKNGESIPVTVVGDEDQCIYTWRGAESENLNAFIRDFPNAKIYKLEQNFRSSANIESLANKLVSNNTNTLDKNLFSELPDGKIRYIQNYDEREEARMTAMQINAEHRKGKPWGSFAILMRMNATSRDFERQFREFGIPHIIWGGFKFFERAEIKSTINYLRVLVNPRDDGAVVDILNFPRRGVGDGSVEKLRNYATENGVSMLEAVECASNGNPKLSSKAFAGVKEFMSVYNNLKSIQKSFSLFDLGASLISTIGLDNHFKQSGKDEDEDRLENVYQLEQDIKSWANDNPMGTLNDYLQTVALVQDADNGDGDSVVISTVHSAKGLEFENVFIIGMEDGVFPLHRAKSSANDMEEERRLFYVAITRAIRNLYVSGCGSRFFQGQRNWATPSEFLIECELCKPSSNSGYGEDFCDDF
jgi:DNA helicase-2/ATP-dependent DNA helicase PcrA